MAQPLFTDIELAALKGKKDALSQKRRDDKVDWKQSWEEEKALDQAHLVEQVKRAQARSEEFLNGLIILVGSKGSIYLEFERAFSDSDAPEVINALRQTSTSDSRRALYTILKALTEIPKSWATSAFIRFLRGTGKQKDSQYHGAGTFGVLYGWKEKEVNAICNVITGYGLYSKVLMSYADVQDEIYKADPGYQVIDYGTQFVATRVERDVEFLNQLCEKLEKYGLGDIPTPQDEKPKKDRKAKIFSPGDVIKKTHIRDLPLPAHIRLQIEKWDEPSKQWLDSTLEQVVTHLGKSGHYQYAIVQPGTQKAHPPEFNCGKSKSELIGATFLGKWAGTIAEKKSMRLTFSYRIKGQN